MDLSLQLTAFLVSKLFCKKVEIAIYILGSSLLNNQYSLSELFKYRKLLHKICISFKERCLFVNETQILCGNFQYLNNCDKLILYIGYLTMKTLKSIWGFQLFYKKVLKQDRKSIVKTNPPHLLQFRWYFNIQCKKYCNYMTVMTLSLSLFIYVKFYLY